MQHQQQQQEQEQQWLTDGGRLLAKREAAQRSAQARKAQAAAPRHPRYLAPTARSVHYAACARHHAIHEQRFGSWQNHASFGGGTPVCHRDGWTCVRQREYSNVSGKRIGPPSC